MTEFDDLPDDAARRLLLRCLSAPGWAQQVLADRPYRTKASLLAAADRAARELSEADLEAALAGHPRIGERAGSGHNAEASAREQAGVVPTGSTDGAGLSIAERLAEANRAYEERFGHVFLIRAAGRTGPEILAELHRRMDNSPESERSETLDNLRQIALARLDQEL